MRLIKIKNIHWDIVRKHIHRPWVLLGWPFIMHLGVNRALIRFGERNRDRNMLPIRLFEIRIPFTSRVVWVNGDDIHKDGMHPVISHRTIRISWMGFLWFWRV